MNIMSYNCKGLAGAHKKYSLKRVVYTEHPEFLLLQETLGVPQEVKQAWIAYYLGVFSHW